MSKELLINVGEGEIRAVLTSDRRPFELVIEREDRKSLIGNIYLAKVRRLMKGMEAAFVDIGEERSGFLPLSDQRGGNSGEPMPEEGETVFVQVIRDAIGRKGPQLSRRLSLAARHLVFVPGRDGSSVSRQISNEAERDRLLELMQAIRELGEGYILRTAAEGAGEAELKEDARYLRALWVDIVAARETAEPPVLLHADLDPLQRILRDYASLSVDRVWIDNGAALKAAGEFCRRFMIGMEGRLVAHDGPEALFDAHGIEAEIDDALEARVPLPSGAGIVIEGTEALTAIDVNSGRAEGHEGAEAAARAVNREAASEVARQIRLRNIGGLIVVDFIDMVEDDNWNQVLEVLEVGFAGDRNSTRIIGRTEAGLVEITRRRRREPLSQIMTEYCSACDGEGWVLSAKAVGFDVLHALRREAAHQPGQVLLVTAAEEVIALLENDFAGRLDGLEVATGRRVELRVEGSYGRGRFDVVAE